MKDLLGLKLVWGNGVVNKARIQEDNTLGYRFYHAKACTCDTC
jgi:hypothetical protein